MPPSGWAELKGLREGDIPRGKSKRGPLAAGVRSLREDVGGVLDSRDQGVWIPEGGVGVGWGVGGVPGGGGGWPGGWEGGGWP